MTTMKSFTHGGAVAGTHLAIDRFYSNFELNQATFARAGIVGASSLVSRPASDFIKSFGFNLGPISTDAVLEPLLTGAIGSALEQVAGYSSGNMMEDFAKGAISGAIGDFFVPS